MKTCILLLMSALAMGGAGCSADPVDAPAPTPTEAEVTASACADLEAAHLAMCQRCGIKPPLPATTTSSAWHYADCGKVKAVTDLGALYDTCLPALASGCYEGDTPAELGCHQFEF